jgi:GT2 family glycosyltransferase
MTLWPRVFISILNWNNAEITLRGLQFLMQLDYANAEIIIIDNASRDDSGQRIRAAYPNVRIIVSPDNNGYAAGNELALKLALTDGADLFWILNPDAHVAPNTLTELVAAYQRGGDALYGSVPLNQLSHVRLQTWALDQHNRPDLSRPLRVEGAYEDCFRDKNPRPIASLHGSSLLIPLSVVRAHGFIDTAFFLYSEEADFSLRLWRAGVPSILVPTSIVNHQPQGAHKHHAALKPVILYYQTRNRLVLLKRYARKPTYFASLIRHGVYVLVWAFASILRGTFALKIAAYTLYGMLDAVRGKMGKTVSPEQFLNG